MKNLFLTLGFVLFLVGCSQKSEVISPSRVERPTQKFSEALVLRALDSNKYAISVNNKEYQAISYEKFKPGDKAIANFISKDTIYIRKVSSKGGKTILIEPAKTHSIKF